MISFFLQDTNHCTKVLFFYQARNVFFYTFFCIVYQFGDLLARVPISDDIMKHSTSGIGKRSEERFWSFPASLLDLSSKSATLDLAPAFLEFLNAPVKTVRTDDSSLHV